MRGPHCGGCRLLGLWSRRWSRGWRCPRNSCDVVSISKILPLFVFPLTLSRTSIGAIQVLLRLEKHESEEKVTHKEVSPLLKDGFRSVRTWYLGNGACIVVERGFAHPEEGIGGAEEFQMDAETSVSRAYGHEIEAGGGVWGRGVGSLDASSSDGDEQEKESSQKPMKVKRGHCGGHCSVE